MCQLKKFNTLKKALQNKNLPNEEGLSRFNVLHKNAELMGRIHF